MQKGEGVELPPQKFPYTKMALNHLPFNYLLPKHIDNKIFIDKI